jgi:hypothetical protein
MATESNVANMTSGKSVDPFSYVITAVFVAFELFGFSIHLASVFKIHVWVRSPEWNFYHVLETAAVAVVGIKLWTWWSVPLAIIHVAQHVGYLLMPWMARKKLYTAKMEVESKNATQLQRLGSYGFDTLIHLGCLVANFYIWF